MRTVGGNEEWLVLYGSTRGICPLSLASHIKRQSPLNFMEGKRCISKGEAGGISKGEARCVSSVKREASLV